MAVMMKRRQSVLVLLVLILLASTVENATANDEFELLDRSRPENTQMLRNHFRTLVHRALDQRLADYEALKTLNQIHSWQKLTGGKFNRVALVSIGELTVPALHMAVLEPELFGTIELKGGLDSWKSVIETPVTEPQLVNVVHGALRYYDLPDLRAMIPDAR